MYTIEEILTKLGNIAEGPDLVVTLSLSTFSVIDVPKFSVFLKIADILNRMRLKS